MKNIFIILITTILSTSILADEVKDGERYYNETLKPFCNMSGKEFASYNKQWKWELLYRNRLGLLKEIIDVCPDSEEYIKNTKHNKKDMVGLYFFVSEHSIK